MDTLIYKRPALGESAWLGNLYDAATDQFLATSILQGTPPESAWTFREVNQAQKITVTGDNLKERFHNMGLSSDLTASILAGSLPIDGSATYLDGERPSHPVGHRALFYTLIATEEELDLKGSDLPASIDMDALANTSATHIVTQVTSGARCIISATKRLESPQDAAGASEALAEAFRPFETGEVEAVSRRKRFQGQLNKPAAFEVTMYSDFPPVGEPSPRDVAGIYSHILQLPDEVAASNHGRGKPLIYGLLPIKFIRLFIDHPDPSSITIPQLSPECVARFVTVLDDVKDAERKLNDYHSKLEHNNICVPQYHLTEVSDQIQCMTQAVETLRSEFASVLKEVREGNTTSQGIWNLIDRFENGDFAPEKLLTMTEKYSTKVEFVDAVMANRALYVGYQTGSLEDAMRDKSGGTAYVFYFNSATMQMSEEWDRNRSLFLRILTEDDPSALAIIVDCDATGKQIDKPSIAQYRGSKLVTEDLSELQGQLANKSLVRYKETCLERTDTVPASRRPLKIPCPAPSCDSREVCTWVCFFCHCQVEFGMDGYFYCDCGRVRYQMSDFKCQSSRHGPDFKRYPGQELYKLLKKLPSPKEVNILILGATGVGKSTFINAFVNYLTFTSLGEALKAPRLNWVIPCSFATHKVNEHSKQLEQRIIRVGHDDTEHDGSKGQSATQKATVYPIYFDGQLVRLIDTPGMGDVRGPEQDKQNMQDVLSVLNSYEQIHGILILLNPVESRLHVMFRFVIEQLLSHLHRSAAHNMVFGFTNSRATNYTPGNIFAPLEDLLSEFKDVIPGLFYDNVYCFDSESFRYLAASSQKVEMGNVEEYKNSWGVSASEAQRMIRHFRGLAPHPVKETVNLCRTRYLILSLVAPIRRISNAILDSIAKSEQQKLDLTKTKATGSELSKKTRMQKTMVGAIRSDRPITACTHISCTKLSKETVPEGKASRHVNGPKVGDQVKIHKSLCHNPCCLEDVEPHKVGPQGLRDCLAFRGDYCKKCSHHWKDHEHILVVYSEETKTVDDPTVLMELEKNGNDVKVKETAIQAIDRYIAELKGEHRQLQEAAARFMVYLRTNSITAFTDAMLEYLDHLINEQKTKVQLGTADPTRLQGLQKEKEQYKAYVETFQNAKRQGVPGAVLSEEGVFQVVKQLYSMRHYGNDLKNVANVVTEAYAATFREKPYHVRSKGFWMQQNSDNLEPTKPGYPQSSRPMPYRSLLSDVPRNKWQRSYVEASADQPSRFSVDDSNAVYNARLNGEDEIQEDGKDSSGWFSVSSENTPLEKGHGKAGDDSSTSADPPPPYGIPWEPGPSTPRNRWLPKRNSTNIIKSLKKFMGK